LNLVDAGNVQHQRQTETQFDDEAEAINAEHHRTSGNALDAGTGNGNHQEPDRHG
jgi:hypothetical protein